MLLFNEMRRREESRLIRGTDWRRPPQSFHPGGISRLWKRARSISENNGARARLPHSLAHLLTCCASCCVTLTRDRRGSWQVLTHRSDQGQRRRDCAGRRCSGTDLGAHALTDISRLSVKLSFAGKTSHCARVGVENAP